MHWQSACHDLTLTSAAQGDTLFLHVLGLVLFAQDRPCLQGHAHTHFSACSTPTYPQYSCGSPRGPSALDAFVLRALNSISQRGSWSNVRTTAQGAGWASGSLNLHHPCPRLVPRPLNHPSSPRVQRNSSIYSRRQTHQIWLPALQAKHDLCKCSFILSVKIALWYSTDTFLIAYTGLSSVLGVKGVGGF